MLDRKDEIWDTLLFSDDWSSLSFAEYNRVSQDDQKKHGESMDVQHKRLQSLLLSKKVRVWDHFPKDAGKSAGKCDTRYDYLEILKNTEKYDVVLCTKLDRWSRNVRDFLNGLDILSKANTILYTLDEGFDYRKPQGKMMSIITVAFSEVEIMTGSVRMTDIHKQRFKEGKMLAKPPYGYKLVEENGVKKVCIVPEEAANIQFIFKNKADKTLSIAEICNAITLTITRNGRTYETKMKKQHCYNILRNPNYKGYIHYKGEKVKSSFPAIVSEDVWERAQ